MMTPKQALNMKNAWLADEVELVVIGAGHAGCEAALAAARLGIRTVIFGMNLDVVANMPCNPNIGGTAKGQLVREIDALGGEMGRAADQTMIQFRMLNSSKGPAVLSPRAQIDRRAYQELMKNTLEKQPNLILRQGEVSELLAESGGEGIQIAGVRTKSGAVYTCRAVIAATGTFLEGRIIMGDFSYSGGPDGLFPSLGLARSMLDLGLGLQRFKTGTPVRINANSVNFESIDRQDGDERVMPFSFENEDHPLLDSKNQQPCWLTWTTPETGQLVQDNIHRSPLFSGDIEGVGPRYCPSIEDKYVKFPDKLRHQVFLEPMGLGTQELYLQGMSSSLPEDVQLKMVQSLPGCEQAVIQRSAYAIEYDCLDPTALAPTLESRSVRGFYAAGQINGSSGYEEAAAQGLIAGINAAHRLLGRDPLVLDRSQAYIGVLIDDLVTKGTQEPYRMMTSRAEYRLLLRQDNADRRLTPIGHEIGLINDARYQRHLTKQENINREIERLRQTRVRPDAAVAAVLEQAGTAMIKSGTTLADLIKRPELDYAALAPLDPDRPALTWSESFCVGVELKYEGYILMEAGRIEQFRKMELKRLPDQIDYMAISGLRLEARQKLDRIRPMSVGQASRISGVSPADISVLLVYLQSRSAAGQVKT